MRDRFTNPSNGSFYDWPLNHDEEDPSGKTRNITRTAPTGQVGLIKQQGDDGPLLLHLKGKILKRTQLQAFWAWYELCRTQTIYFRDFDNQQFEVQITSFVPQRHRKLKFPSPGNDPNTHYWTYDMEMEVYRVIAGDLAGVTP